MIKPNPAAVPKTPARLGHLIRSDGTLAPPSGSSGKTPESEMRSLISLRAPQVGQAGRSVWVSPRTTALFKAQTNKSLQNLPGEVVLVLD